jgi:hypothetical protein
MKKPVLILSCSCWGDPGLSWLYLEDREGDGGIEIGRIEKSAAQDTEIDHRRVLISAILRM